MLNGQETHMTGVKRWFMKPKQWRLSFYGTRFDSNPTQNPPHNTTIQYHILISFLTSHEGRGCLRIKKIHDRNTKPCFFLLESVLNKRRRRWRSYSLLTPRGGYSQFVCFVDFDHASTVYPPQIIRRIKHTPKIIKSSNPSKIFQFCILTFRKSPRMLRNSSQN